METIKNLVTTHCADYVLVSRQFNAACANESTRNCKTLGECAGLLPRLIADAYLMGGEL